MLLNADNDDETKLYAGLVLNKGTLVGHYRITERRGAGGMGEVFAAEDTQLNRKVALKFISAGRASDESLKIRLLREAQAAAKLNHPAIVTIHEVSEFKGVPYFVMEFIDGQSLNEYVRATQPSLGEIIALSSRILEGLNEAHRNDIVHRDIKPSNILVDKNGRPKILDFGLAITRDTERITEDGSTLGTIGYMSPEQVLGKPVDRRSDIFSFGVLLYEMIAGRAPFAGEYEASILYSIANSDPKPLTEYRVDVPEELRLVVEKTLKKDPDARYQSVDELLADLRKFEPSRTSGFMGDSALAAVRDPSIAVLPFKDLSSGHDQEFFCDGMAEEIIIALSHIQGLHVVARTSAFSFKEKSFDIREIGRKLGVATLLEGSLRKSGDHLRITAQLIDVKDGYHLWSEKYDRDIEDVFAVQDEISLAIVENLKLKLLAGERNKLVKRFTDDPAAYGLYLKGRFFWNRRYAGGLQKGIECFEQAIRQDPSYAPAYVGLADCYNQLGFYGYWPARKAYGKGKESVAKALTIDDTLSEAYACLGWIKTFHEWDWEGAENAFQQALSLNPNCGLSHNWYGLFLAIRGRHEESFREGIRTLEIDPVCLIFNAVLGLGYYWMHQTDTGIEHLKKTMEMDPSFSLTHLFLGFAYEEKQEWDKAIASLKEFTRLSSNSSVGLGHLGLAYGLCGKTAEARGILEQLRQLSIDGFVSDFYPALVYMGLGDHDTAFDHFRKAVQDRESWMATLETAPFLKSLRKDPRYASLTAAMGPEK